MPSTDERVCVGCGDAEENARLERCPICSRYFCPDCAHRSSGRRFCGSECARAFWFQGDDDDDQDVDAG